MAQLINPEPSKTYATIGNAIKAVEKSPLGTNKELRYIVVTHTDGRFYPLFIGERAITAGVHYFFNVIN